MTRRLIGPDASSIRPLQTSATLHVCMEPPCSTLPTLTSRCPPCPHLQAVRGPEAAAGEGCEGVQAQLLLHQRGRVVVAIPEPGSGMRAGPGCVQGLHATRQRPHPVSLFLRLHVLDPYAFNILNAITSASRWITGAMHHKRLVSWPDAMQAKAAPPLPSSPLMPGSMTWPLALVEVADRPPGSGEASSSVTWATHAHMLRFKSVCVGGEWVVKASTGTPVGVVMHTGSHTHAVHHHSAESGILLQWQTLYI
jgi:hypothetical protein